MKIPHQLSLIIFFVLLLLTIFFGESYLRFILFGLWSIFLVSHWSILEFHKITRFSTLIGAWLFFLFALFLSTWFTHSLPLTIDAIVFHLQSFLIFWFFVLLPKEFYVSKIFQLGLLFIGVVMTVIGTVFFLLPQLAINVPGMNMFVSTYGHNHLGALLLLFIPIVMGLMFQEKKHKTKMFYVLLFFLFVLGVILSFGRTILILATVEVLIGYWWWKKEFAMKSSNVVDRILKFFFILLISVTTFYIVVSAYPTVLAEYQCPRFLQRIKVCKNWREEGRWLYWQQGFKAVTDFPLFGYGPGTFPLISKKYQQIPGIYTAYGHNAFIQQFAETGLLGGISFVVLIVTILLNVFIYRHEKISLLQAMIIIAIGISMLNALADFDWSFSGIYFLTLILCAKLLNRKEISLNEKQKQRLLTMGFRTIYFFLIIVITVLAGISIWSEYSLSKNKYEQLVRVFPYFFSQRLILADADLSQSAKAQLATTYFYHSDVQSKLFTNNKRHLFSLDPWTVIQQETRRISEGQSTLSANELQQYTLLLLKTQYQYNSGPPELVYKHWPRLLLVEADNLLLKNNGKQAGEFYVLAHRMHEWVLNYHRPVFIDNQVEIEQVEVFLTQVDFIPGQYFGAYADDFANLYLRYLRDKWDGLNPTQREKVRLRILEIAWWKEEELKYLFEQQGINVIPDAVD